MSVEIRGSACVMRGYDGGLHYEARPVPVPGPTEVLVEVHACGVCATDVKAYHGLVEQVEPPRVLGHEIAGRIVRVGPAVDATRVGESVVIYFREPCGKCGHCRAMRENLCLDPGPRPGFERDGGFQTHLVVRADCALQFKRLGFEQAAILADAVATAWHAAKRGAAIQRGDDVLIIGAGGLGIHAAQIARHLGANVLVLDLEDERIACAQRLGFSAGKVASAGSEGVVATLRELDMLKEICTVIDCAGVGASRELVVGLRSGFRFVAVGYSPSLHFEVFQQDIVRHEGQIAGIRACTRLDLENAIALAQEGKLHPVVGTSYPYADVLEALNRTSQHSGAGRSVVAVRPSSPIG